MQAVALLCEIIAHGGAVVASSYSEHTDFAFLLANGFVIEAGRVKSLPCLNCDEPHDAEIVHHDGRNGFFCPEVGFVPVLDHEIGAVRANVPKIIDALANAFDCRARKSSPLSGATWRIGRVSSKAGDIAVYFHPCLRAESDARDLSTALALEPGSRFRLILSAAGDMQIPGAKTVPLVDVVEFDASGLSGTVFRSVADLRDLVGAPRKNVGGAPNRFGEILSALIKGRIAERKALEGRNEEARAVLTELILMNPHLKAPSLSSVRDYVSKIRAGQ